MPDYYTFFHAFFLYVMINYEMFIPPTPEEHSIFFMHHRQQFMFSENIYALQLQIKRKKTTTKKHNNDMILIQLIYLKCYDQLYCTKRVHVS